MDQHCHGWVMVRAENTPSDILQALDEGAFYASCGPEIHDFYVEDNMAYIDCSETVSVCFHSLRSPLRKTAGEHITHADCGIPAGLRYIRAVVTDAAGRRAWTNPIFLR
jgi:hypothetical protein